MNTKTRKTHRTVRSGVGTGTTSLLMIFTVLCFATLALLSLSTAASNQRIQEKGLAGTAALAVAEGEAAEKLAELDAALLSVTGESEAENAALQLGWQREAAGRFSYTIAFDGAHELVTVVELGPEGEGGRYRMVGQSSSYTGAWTPEAPGDIWSGE